MRHVIIVIVLIVLLGAGFVVYRDGRLTMSGAEAYLRSNDLATLQASLEQDGLTFSVSRDAELNHVVDITYPVTTGTWRIVHTFKRLDRSSLTATYTFSSNISERLNVSGTYIH